MYSIKTGNLRNVYGFKKEKKLVIEIRTDFQKSKPFQVDDSSFKFDRRNDFLAVLSLKSS